MANETKWLAIGGSLQFSILFLIHRFLIWKYIRLRPKGKRMEKAFDLKDLEARLKAKGLPVVEGIAKIVVEETLAWCEESVLLTPNKIDDLSVVGIEAIKPYIMGQIDKIDGVASPAAPAIAIAIAPAK